MNLKIRIILVDTLNLISEVSFVVIKLELNLWLGYIQIKLWIRQLLNKMVQFEGKLKIYSSTDPN